VTTADPYRAESAFAPDGAANYLGVRYAEAKTPYSSYPRALTRYLNERFLAQLHAGTGERKPRLLDLGAGRGEFLDGFAALGFAAVGVDRSRPPAPRHHAPILLADYERSPLPFADAEFDVLFSKSVFEHVWDISRLLAECHRVLAPGGRLIALVPDWRAQWRHFYDDWTHVRPFTLTGLRECVACHGFTIQTAERFRQLPELWERPWLTPLATLASFVPRGVTSSKFVRFSKEWMLLVVADRV
jgi:SAM-dependent methyltransferase